MNEQQTSQPNVEILDQSLSVQSAPSAQSTFDDELISLRTENSDLKNQLRLRTARDELTRTLTFENARSPELLFEAASSRLVFDDDGKLTNLSDLIAEIRTRFPEQFVVEPSEPQQTAPLLRKEGWTPERRTGWSGTREDDVPAINAGAGRIGARPPLTKAMLAEMNPRDIANLNWSDVKQVMES